MMKTFNALTVVTALATCMLFADSADAQSEARQAIPAATVSSQAKIVGFRATEWQTIHSGTTLDAEQAIATLKKLGCEVDSDNHGDHVDVKFRCPEWRSMKLDTDMLVNQWSMWCDNQGMETVVVNPPANTKKPVVRFRMAQAKTVHLHDPLKAKQIINTLTLIGCQITTEDHNGHLDTTFVCPDWKTIELTTEDSAHAWQSWLNDSGFETQHTHVH